MTTRSYFGRMASSLLLLTLAACGGGGGDSPPASFTIGGTISGLDAGQVVTLANGADTNALTGTGASLAFTFTAPVANLGSYAVTVSGQPANQMCSLSAGTGSGAGVNADVNTVAVTCSADSYNIGGSVAGLTGGQVVTLMNGADVTTVTGGGTGTDPFNFATKVAFQGSYAVAIGTQPSNQVCSVSGGTGSASGVNADVSTVTIACSSSSYNIGGTVAGLAAGQTVTLVDNAGIGGNVATVTGGGTGSDTFTFTTKVAFQGSYGVAVSTQPTNQSCGISNGTGSGSGVNADVSTVTITCSSNSYNIGGTVTGLVSGQSVTLVDNGGTGGNIATVTGGGTGSDTFTFLTKVPFQGSYGVALSTQPTNQSCGVSNGTSSGSGVNADVTTVNIACSSNSYNIGGTVTGLVSGQSVTLVDNGGTGGNIATVTGGGTGSDTFTFLAKVPFQGSYGVAVSTQPTNQSCGVSNGTGSGSGVNADVSMVTIACSSNSYNIGGTVTGLVSGQSVTLVDNGGTGGNIATVTGGGTGSDTFTFVTKVPFQDSYGVTVGTQPTGQTCRITGGSGTNVTAAVNSVAITCRLALAYVVNSTAGNISQYTIGLDGALTEFATRITTGSTASNVITVDPSGRYAYVANHDAVGTVSEFAIDPTTGALSSLGTVGTGGPTPYAVAVDPSGKYVYVTNQDDPSGTNSSVAQFKIGPAGTLTPIGSGLVTMLNGGATSVVPYQITIESTGHHAYVANRSNSGGTGSISQFDIDSSTGALTWVADLSTGSGSGSLGIAISGANAYVSNFDVNTVAQYSIDASTGRLSMAPVQTSASEVHPYPVAISADGQFAYWANKASGSVSQSKIDQSTGALSSGTNTIGGVFNPQYVAIDPFSRHVYVVNYADASLTAGQGSTIGQYNIDTVTGDLTPISGAPTVVTGLGPFSIVITR